MAIPSCHCYTCYSGGVGGVPNVTVTCDPGRGRGVIFWCYMWLRGGRGGPPCYRYLLHGVRELMLPVTTITRPPVACYMLQFCSTKVRFWHVTKLKLHIFGGNFQKNVTKCYKVPIKSVTSGVYIFRYYMLRLLRGGRGGPPCYRYKALQSGGMLKS